MCGRYENNNEIIYPGDSVEILIEYHNRIVRIKSSWGFLFNGKLVFNARCETIDQKALFKGLKHCIIQADHYFEWDQSKNKVIFENLDNTPLFMAGLVRKNNHKNEHTIITTLPNESVQGIHDRMPLILNRKDAIKWLMNKDTERILNSVPSELDVYKNIEQMELEL